MARGGHEQCSTRRRSTTASPPSSPSFARSSTPKADAWATLSGLSGGAARGRASGAAHVLFGSRDAHPRVRPHRSPRRSETQFNSMLAPVRADVGVTLVVIEESESALYEFDQAAPQRARRARPAATFACFEGPRCRSPSTLVTMASPPSMSADRSASRSARRLRSGITRTASSTRSWAERRSTSSPEALLRQGGSLVANRRRQPAPLRARVGAGRQARHPSHPGRHQDRGEVTFGRGPLLPRERGRERRRLRPVR